MITYTYCFEPSHRPRALKNVRNFGLCHARYIEVWFYGSQSNYDISPPCSKMEESPCAPRLLRSSLYGTFPKVRLPVWNLYITLQFQSKAPMKASESSQASYAKLKEKRAWDFAISPAKSLPMQAFMLYMSGGGVQIFSMGIVFMLLMSPFKNIAAINTGEYQAA